MEYKTKHLIFDYNAEESLGKKTKVFEVLARGGSMDTLGWIKWYPSWRQYCFFAEYDTFFSRDCLSDITQFIYELMEERKVKKPSQ